jgi:DNA-binding beta-propeller fold protein YncE
MLTSPTYTIDTVIQEREVTMKRSMRWRLNSSLTLLIAALGCTFWVAPSNVLPEETSKELRLLKVISLPGVEGRFDHFAVDVKSHRLFVAALGNNTLEVVDAQANKRVTSVPNLREPQGMAFAPDLRRLYVGNGEGNRCDMIEGNTLHLLQSVSGLPDADNVRYDAHAHQVYVGYGDGALAFLDARTGRRIREAKLSGHPESFQLEKEGPRIFINVPSARQIVVLNRATGKVEGTWTVQGARSNFPMALDEAHHRLFVGCRNPARLLVYDTETGREVAQVAIVGDTDDLFYDSGRKRLYVSGGEGFISVLEQKDPDHYSLLVKLPTAEGARTSYFVPEWNRFYLAVPHRGHQIAEIRVYATHPS